MSAKAVWNAWTHTWKKEAEEKKKSGKRGHARDWLSGVNRTDEGGGTLVSWRVLSPHTGPHTTAFAL